MQPQSTPASRRISNDRSFSVYSADEADDFIKTELVESRVRSVDADTFLAFAGLEALWNDSEWDRRFNELKLDKSQTDLRNKWLEIRDVEKKQYPPFCEWANHLISHLVGGFQHLDPRPIKLVPLGETLIPVTPGYADGKQVDGTSSSIKPDAACVLEGEALATRKWYQVLAPVEFKKGSPPRPKAEGASARTSTSSSHHLEVVSDTTSSRRRRSSKRSGSVLEESEPPVKKVRMSIARIQSRTTTANTRPNSTSSLSKGPTWDEVQLARYELETLTAVGDRTHSFGLAVKRPQVTLWYYDRCGAVHSPPLNVEDPWNPDFLAFVKFLSALVYMEDAVLGFNPSFADSSGTKRTKMRQDLSKVPIKIPEADEVSLELQEVLERRAGLVSRATLVYKAQMRVKDKVETVVIKTSWQHVQRRSECDILQELHRDSRASQHVVKAIYGWDGPKVSSLRTKFGEPVPDVVDDRVLRYAVFEYLPPVTELSQPFHIPHIGWSVLRAIRFLHAAGWFHRDISVGNIGYATLACEGVIVKLRDFDLSKEIGKSSGAPHWTGTVPFMSIELLQNPGTEHKVGFEVEALVWTLLWIVRVYRNGKDEHEVSDHPLMNWFSNSFNLSVLATNKDGYLKRTGFTNDFYKDLEKPMKDLARELHKMREDLLTERDTADNDQLLPERIYGMGGLERIEDWMKKRGWDEPSKTCSCKKHCALS